MAGQLAVPRIASHRGLFDAWIRFASFGPMVKAVPDGTTSNRSVPNAVCWIGAAYVVQNRHAQHSNVVGLVVAFATRPTLRSSFMGTTLALVVHA